MSNHYKFELNKEGVRQLLRSANMQDIISAYGERVQKSAGEEYKMESRVNKDRCVVKVKLSTPHAYYSELKHNTLLKALGSSRGK